MTIREINNKCVALRSVCDEVMVRYRDRLVGRVGAPESKREEVLDEAINCMEFLADVDEAGEKMQITLNVDGKAIFEAIRGGSIGD